MISEFLTQRITRIRYVENAIGVPSGDNAVVMSARCEKTQRSQRDADGNKVNFEYRIYLAPDTDISISDFIVLGIVTSGGQEREYAIKSIFDARGFFTSHKEVYV